MHKPWQEKQQREEEESLQHIQDYENNLQLHYESKRKELDLLISSSLPHQINNIKMILWINFLFFGISASILKELQFHWIYLIPYSLSSFAIAMMIMALTQRRSKMYGGIDDVNYIHSNIKDGVYAKSKMLSGLLNNVFKAVEYNRKTLQTIAKYLRASTIATFISIVLFFVFFLSLNLIAKDHTTSSSQEKVVIINKIYILKEKGENNMAEKDQRPVPSEVNPPQRPIHEAEERDSKPTPKPHPQEEKK